MFARDVARAELGEGWPAEASASATPADLAAEGYAAELAAA